MEQKQEMNVHKLLMTGRKQLSLTGVKEVISFDQKEVILDTTQGTLMLRGDELNITRLLLEKGETEVEGRIDSIVYTERGKKRREESFAKRLFG